MTSVMQTLLTKMDDRVDAKLAENKADIDAKIAENKADIDAKIAENNLKADIDAKIMRALAAIPSGAAAIPGPSGAAAIPSGAAAIPSGREHPRPKNLRLHQIENLHFRLFAQLCEHPEILESPKTVSPNDTL